MNYDLIYMFATNNKLDYNELCELVKQAATPQPASEPAQAREWGKDNLNCAVSWNSFNLFGDDKSVAELRRLIHIDGCYADLQRVLAAEKQKP